MAITAGSLIVASDYNVLIGASTGTAAFGSVNGTYGIGTGDRGYGQTAISQVAIGNTVTAVQWANAINAIRNMRNHQSNTPGSFTAPTAGTVVTASTIAAQSEMTTATTNRLLAFATGSTTSSNYNYTMSAAIGASATNTQTRTVTFSSIDQCRYFFNAGGRITWDFTSGTNNDGTSRSAAIVTLGVTNINAYTMLARSASGRTGSSGTVTTNIIGLGFYNLLTTNTNFCTIESDAYPYITDYMQLNIRTNGGAGSYSGNGNIVTLELTTFSGTTGSSSFNDTLNVTMNYTITVTYPSTTYLGNSWGTATIA
jgi:hypothetical protein